MLTTSRGAFPYPEGTDNRKLVRQHIEQLAARMGVVATLYGQGTAAQRPPAAGNAGTLWHSTDTGAVDFSTGLAWIALIGNYQPANLEGTLAARPAATAVPAKTVYFATDDNGGTLYRSNGTAWRAVAPGTAVAVGTADLAKVGITVEFNTNSVFPNYVDVPGMTGCAVVVPTGGSIRVCLDMVVTATTGNGSQVAPVWQVVDETGKVAMDGSYYAPIALAQGHIHHERKITGLTAGATKTYKLQLSLDGSGNVRILGSQNNEASLYVRAA